MVVILDRNGVPCSHRCVVSLLLKLVDKGENEVSIEVIERQCRRQPGGGKMINMRKASR